jgi:NAD-dependent deacetylase
MPNAAHEALAKAQNVLAGQGRTLTICTQNVDDLHEKAGSSYVIHMHGRLGRVRCEACGQGADYDADLSLTSRCAACGATGRGRPDVVWFGEIPHDLELIEACLLEADLFVAIGTSGSVYPAAGFVAMARKRGIQRLELNLEPSDNAEMFSDGCYGKASVIVPKWVSGLIGAA